MTYTVTAEDGTTTQDWVVTVTKAVVLNDEADILTYSFGTPPQTGDATINSTAHTVDVEVESGTDVTNLVATFTLSDGATVKVGSVEQTSGTTTNDFSSPVTYTVTAEDGTTTHDWVVTVTKAVVLNDEADILTYSFGTPPQTGDATINSTAHTVNVEVESGTDATGLVATFTLSDGATAKVGDTEQVSGTTANNFSSPVTYTVTAEDGTTTQDWVVTVTKAVVLNDEANILTYSFGMPPQTGEALVDAELHLIEIEVESGTDLTNLVADFTLSDGATATVGGKDQVSGTTANDFTSPVTYTVTAEDGAAVQEWDVVVSEEVVLNSETRIYSFSFDSPPQVDTTAIDSALHTVNVAVEEGTDLTNLIPTFELSVGATATVNDITQISGITANDFTDPVVYTVTSEDGDSIQDWTVTVEISTKANLVAIPAFNVYPNPFSEKTTVEFSNNEHRSYKLILYNATGNKVLEMAKITSDKITLERGSLKSGIYFIELKGEKTFQNKMIVIR